MSGDYVALLIAVVGVLGTLFSSLLSQQLAARARREEQLETKLQRHEDREWGAKRDEFVERRTCYVAMNTAARQYITAIDEHLHCLRSGTVTEADRASLSRARNDYLERYAEAQMIATDKVLDVAGGVNSALGQAYGSMMQLTAGESPPEQMFANIRLLWKAAGAMRGVMREDLGVTGSSVPGTAP